MVRSHYRPLNMDLVEKTLACKRFVLGMDLTVVALARKSFVRKQMSNTDLMVEVALACESFLHKQVLRIDIVCYTECT